MKANLSIVRIVAFVTFTPASSILAVSPPPGGAYPKENTALGQDALFSLPPDASGQNTALGYQSMYKNTYGGQSVAVGDGALSANTLGDGETAVGYQALYSNTTGNANVAIGEAALYSNTTGESNVSVGSTTLVNNTTGIFNTALGDSALTFSTTGSYNTALGAKASAFDSTGHDNAAVGYGALNMNTTGIDNVAVGSFAAGFLTTGSNNTVLGFSAGSFLKTGSNNIEIGHVGGSASEANAIRIGTPGTQTATYVAGIRGVALGGLQPVGVNAAGQLGVRGSSARFKKAIKPMDKQSEAILALRPVSFRYKKDLDSLGAPQFGLVAEEVAQVAPELVVRDEQGKPFSVRYEEVNAMLLNEFLKEHRKVEQQAGELCAMQSSMTRQEEAIVTLTAALKEQARQMQKVSAQLEANRPARRLVSTGE
ncbi:MAG: tail fiber domain-containing protein [Chthoniobacterales bacterium]|nr:tail fiber domain-containing protein [Chthoniobacterales bacterium]